MKKLTLFTLLVSVLVAFGAQNAFAGAAKVSVCHIPPGNPDNFHTITISEKAYAAHLAHGDVAGACDAACATLCDDGNACTIDDTGDCELNGCPVTPEAVDCNDGNTCTMDVCEPMLGCVNTADPGALCDDGQTCTGVDTCNAEGECKGPQIDNCCLTESDCSENLCDNASCNVDTNRCVNDPVVCNPPDLCSASACISNTGECADTPIVCAEGESCELATGECVAISSYQCDLTGTTASATSVFNGTYSADRAIDGNKTTGLGWIPLDNAGYPQTLTLDFGTIRGDYISSVTVTQVTTSSGLWYKTKDYEVDVSQDGFAWTNVVTDQLESANAFNQKNTFTPIQARYVRLVVKTGWDTAPFNRGGGILENEFNCQ